MFTLLTEDDIVINFHSEEDRNLYLNEINRPTRNMSFDTILSSVNLNNRHIATNPLTPNRSFASQYAISVTSNLNINNSVQHNGFNLGVSTSIQRGVTISLPADANRASRLGIREM